MIRGKRQSVFGAGLLFLLAGALSLAGQASDAKSTAKKSAAQPSKAEAAIERGKEQYELVCGICHYSTTERQKVGPGLKEIYKRGKFADGRKVDDRSMREWIEKGGRQMPPFKDVLSPREIANLIAYLRTL